MQGVAIVDSAGCVHSLASSLETVTDCVLAQRRRILSTHFPSTLQANLAIDAAVASSSPVLWVPGVTGQTADEGDEESEDEEDEDERPWAHASRRSGGGVAVCQVRRNGLRFVSVVDKDGACAIPDCSEGTRSLRDR